jgi:hypothetical protein
MFVRNQSDRASWRHYKESDMKRMFALLSGAVVAAGLSVGALAQDDGHKGHDHSKKSAEAKEVTVQGELIDTACFVTSDGDAQGKDHAECATKCMGSGVPAGILPEGSKDADAVMFLLTNPTVLAPYSAQTIKVEGTQYEDKHAIDVKKLYVKDGENWKEIQLKDEHHKMAEGAAPAAVAAPAGGTAPDGHAGHEKK